MIDALPKIQRESVHFYSFHFLSFFQLYYHNNTVEEVRVKYLTSSPIDFNLALKEEINKVKKKISLFGSEATVHSSSYSFLFFMLYFLLPFFNSSVPFFLWVFLCIFYFYSVFSLLGILCLFSNLSLLSNFYPQSCSYFWFFFFS